MGQGTERVTVMVYERLGVHDAAELVILLGAPLQR
jgi:hypothetical protein